MSRVQMRRRIAGFSLLEAIVTLVIVSMLVAMLMQALSQSLGLRTRLIRLYGESREMQLQEVWFRETVAAAQPPVVGASDAFEGGAASLSYVSAAPLVASGSARVRWWLAADQHGDLALHYSDDQADDLVVVRGPLSEAGFSYGAPDAAWRSNWIGLPPPRTGTFDAAPGEAVAAAVPDPVLPRLVRFQAITEQGRRLDWIIHLASDLRTSEQPGDFEEVEGGI